MIDNNHLAYAGVIMVFLLGMTIVALVGMLFLAVGFAVSTAVRFRKRRARQKRLKAPAAVPADEEHVVPPVSFETNASHPLQGFGWAKQGQW